MRDRLDDDVAIINLDNSIKELRRSLLPLQKSIRKLSPADKVDVTDMIRLLAITELHGYMRELEAISNELLSC